MKILLVVPRYIFTSKKNYGYMFPLGLAYISSAMKKEGHQVDCLNLNHLDGTTEDLLIKKLSSRKYDVVCSGHLGIGYSAIEKIINISKMHPSKPKTIIGGAIVTAESKLMFESLKPDYAVVGEGDLTITELLEALGKSRFFEKVKGIIYWNKNKLVFTPPRPAIENLDELPLPDFEGLEFEKQLDNMGANNSPYGLSDYPRVYPIMCSRGCPFQCTFCYHCLGLKYRTRSINNVMDELRTAVKKYRINIIVIYDDLFSLDKERLYGFCKEIREFLKEIPWKCKWTCQLAVRDVDREMLKIIKDAGCYAVSYGFESYSKKVLDSMKKPITPQQIHNAISLTREAGLLIQGNFIFGDRAETKNTAKETLNYWKKNCRGEIYLGFIQPYPGSDIYNHCIKKGIIRDRIDYIKNKMIYTNWFNMTDSMTDDEVLELKKDILRARREYAKYIVPLKIKKETKQDRYSLLIRCPSCKKLMNYKNHFIQDRLVYILSTSCKNCKIRFNIVSPLYYFGVKHHEKIEFLKNLYLTVRDSILKKTS